MKIRVHVKPNASEDTILSWNEAARTMEVAIAAPPEKNKANIALLKLLKRHFGKPVYLISGGTSKEKLVEVTE